ncbi:MAG: hypothetical protein N2692_02260 [Patescibacteria group bacterium]|jgi:cell division protein FtsB|nr:hypothetical protein [Patescibacteria group bacterium]
MTVISLKHNRYNLVAHKTVWEKRAKINSKKAHFLLFINLLLMGVVVFSIIFSLFSKIQMNNYRLDLKELSAQLTSLEHKNAELKNQINQIKDFEKLPTLFEKSNLSVVNNPNYFSTTKKSTEVGVNKLQSL